MRVVSVVLFAVLCIICLTGITAASDVSLHTPTSIQPNESGWIYVRVKDDYENPVTGASAYISCYVQYPNGTMFFDGVHPLEDFEHGLYYIEFKNGREGIYPCWVTWNGLIDAGLFQIKSDVTDYNASVLSQMIGDQYSFGRNDRYALAQQTAYMLSTTTAKVQNVTRTEERFNVINELRDTAIGQSLQVVFWSITLTVASVVSTLVMTRRRRYA
jgi:hypothetical protein